MDIHVTWVRLCGGIQEGEGKSDDDEVSLCLISFPSVDWIEEFKTAYDKNNRVQDLLAN